MTSMPALAPQFGHTRRVQLGAAGFRIVEVAPGQDRDPPQARGRGDIAELRDRVVARAEVVRVHEVKTGVKCARIVIRR